MSDNQKQAAKEFAESWKGKGYEKGESQPFWLSLLRDVYGVEHPEEYIKFEESVHIDRAGFIDGYISTTRVMIEQKKIGQNLNKPIKQSDGSFLTPFQQAKRYIVELPVDQHPRFVITCNFEEFWVYDMNKPGGEPEKIKLADLENEYYRLQFLTDRGNDYLKKEVAVSVKAGEIVGLLYDAFIKQYNDPKSENTLKSLNILCVRLVFCLYAENAGIFGHYGMFREYMEAFETQHMRRGLKDLFHILNTKAEERDPYLKDDNPTLAAFPYVNGGLFADEEKEIPPFNDEIRTLLLERASEGFNWSDISPTIFGAVFESTLNPETRRAGGMHYTSIENIHKVIDPLFMDSLYSEFGELQSITIEKERQRKLKDFQNKIASLKFLDPACGSGNFLTESYLSLRRLENKVLQLMSHGQSAFGFEDLTPIKVSPAQFYGIEINDFAVSVAKTALWIAEHQTMKETEQIVRMHLDYLPLKSYDNIIEGNALRIKWESIVSKNKLTYIMGNPPFVGARLMNDEQKEDILYVLQDWQNSGNLDYVSGWYKKASDIMKGTKIRTALVSTNSISQGEQVALLWRPLLEAGAHIDFAHRTFRWDSESQGKAHVHCVIIGFSCALNNKPKLIYTNDRYQKANNINGYLLDAPDILIDSRNKPLCDVPEIGIGNQPIDDGNYLFSEDERNEFINREPKSAEYFRPWYGAQEFINQKPRFCLWLGECSPAELREMPECMKRVEAVRNYRLASKRSGTVKLADSPTRFLVENMPENDYLLIPSTSSEQRHYIPIGFIPRGVLCSNAVHIIPSATLYHFGILTSNVHNGWMRAVCGRLKSDYRYSKDIVYNNFPWPKPTPEQKKHIEDTALAILNARQAFPDSSLADLYDEIAMPPSLRKAHHENDRAVMMAYGWGKGEPEYSSESACVASLLRLYQSLRTKK